MARTSRVGLPDMNYIRREVPVIDVAKGLDLRIAGKNSAHCWRLERHRHGDRTPSLSFYRNRAKCHVCDPRALSTIDLVMVHENCSLPQAVTWICARWEVPLIPKHAKLVRTERWYAGRVGASSFPLESIVRTGFWASLDDAGRAVLVALVCFADPTTSSATISYRALCRYSGKASRTTIAKVLRHFEHIDLVKVVRARDDDGMRRVGSYKFTIQSERFQTLLSNVHEHLKAERDLEQLLLRESEPKSPSLNLPKSRSLSTTVDQRESPRFTTLDRSLGNEPEMQSARFTTVDRGNWNGATGQKPVPGAEELRLMPCYVHRQKTPHWNRGEDWLCGLCRPNPVRVQ
jgi:hypothetical protein